MDSNEFKKKFMVEKTSSIYDIKVRNRSIVENNTNDNSVQKTVRSQSVIINDIL